MTRFPDVLENDSQQDFIKRLVVLLAAAFAISALWSLIAPRPMRPPPDVASSSAPTATPQQPIAAAAPSLAIVAPVTAAVTAAPAVGEPAPRRILARTTEWEVELSNVGGRLTSWKLLNHGDYAAPNSPVELVHRRSSTGSQITASDDQDILPLQVITGDALLDKRLALANHAISVEDAPGKRILRASWSDGQGLSIEKILTLREAPAIATLEAKLTVGGRPASFWIAWGPGIANHLPGDRSNVYFRRGQVSFWSNGKVRTVTRADKPGDIETSTVGWVALEDSYFAVVVVPAATVDATGPGANGGAASGFRVAGSLPLDADGKTSRKDWPEELILHVPFTPELSVQGLVVGPRQRPTLAALAPAFRGAPPLASLTNMGLLDPIASLLHRVLLGLKAWTSSWGLAIVLLTLLVRTVMAPLQFFSMKKMRAMQDKLKPIQSRQKALEERYKKLPPTMENRTRHMEERSKLMQEAGINPTDTLSGCLPMLISMPVFFAMLRLLTNTPEFRHEAFAWWHDLAAADATHVLPILAGVLTLVSTKLSMSTTQGMDPMQKNMLYVFPVMLGWICWSAPVAFALYQFAMSGVQIGQQYLFNLFLPRTDAAPAARSKPDDGPRGEPSAATATLSGAAVPKIERKKGRKR
jgi:YidC/Oxa1 family membrane protein insertase